MTGPEGAPEGVPGDGPEDGPVLGSAAWTRATGGNLTRAERRTLLRRLARGHLDNVAGRARLALRRHPGRLAEVDPDALVPPDSVLARDAAAAAADLLSPALLHHSHRSYAWGSALAALEGVDHDRELFFVAAMLHDTGLPTPADGLDFTVASAEIADRFLDAAALPGTQRQVVLDAICLHHSPGIVLGHGPEAYLMSAGAAVDVFGMRTWDLPDAVRRGVVDTWPRVGFKREFSRLWAAESRRVPRGRARLLHRYAVSALTIRAAPFRG